VAVQLAAIVSDKSALEACIRDDVLYKLTIFTFSFLYQHLKTFLFYRSYPDLLMLHITGALVQSWKRFLILFKLNLPMILLMLLMLVWW